MTNVLMGVRRLAQGLVRCEIVLLLLIYIYFVVSDSVPLAAFGLIALIWLARVLTTGRLTITTPLDLPILILLLWLLLSLSVSIDWRLSLPKIYGVVLGVAFFYAIVNQVAMRRALAWATFWLVLACAAIALAGLVGTDWAQGKIVSLTFIYDYLPRVVQGIPRSIAGGFARNGVGGTLTFTIPLLAALAFVCRRADTPRAEGQSQAFATSTGSVLAKPRKANACERSGGAGEQAPLPACPPRKRSPLPELSVHRLLAPAIVIALALSLITLALTQSRGAILGTAVGLFAVAVWRERRFAWLLVAGVVGLIVLIALGYGNALIEFLLRIDTGSGTLASRLEVWQRGVMMVQDFPFTGIGIGTYNVMAHLQYPFFIAAPDELVSHAHNNLLEVAVDLGIPGFIAYVALLTGFVICAVRAYRAAVDASGRALIAGLAFGMLAHQTFGLTDAFILGTKPGVVMWVFFALVAAMDARRSDDK